MKTINIAEKLAQITDHWDPRPVARYNGNDIMVVKFQGEFPFHSHPDTDDFFQVIEGEIVIDIEEHGKVTSHPLTKGEIFVIPAGVRHRPRAETEAQVLLIEPTGTPNTGDIATAAAKAWL